MEITIEAKPIYTVKVCEKCFKGHMKLNNFGMSTLSTHRCTKCDNEAFYNVSYPIFSYIYDEADIEKELEKRKEKES